MQCIGYHKSHTLLKLVDKYKKLKNKLKIFERVSSKHISKIYEDVESCANKVEERFRSQYEIIEKRLFEVLKQHITQMKIEKKKELNTLDSAKKKLEKFRSDIDNILHGPKSANLIQQCGRLISLEKKLTLEFSWKKPTYIETSTESFSKELFEFSKYLGHCEYDKISASFSPEHRKDEPTVNSSHQKGKSTDPKLDYTKQKSFTLDIEPTDQLSNKVFIAE